VHFPGLPGQIGQGSLAALWQTVITMRILGASAPANSFQLSLPTPVVEIPASARTVSATGLIRPLGAPRSGIRSNSSPDQYRRR